MLAEAVGRPTDRRADLGAPRHIQRRIGRRCDDDRDRGMPQGLIPNRGDGCDRHFGDHSRALGVGRGRLVGVRRLLRPFMAEGDAARPAGRT